MKLSTALLILYLFFAILILTEPISVWAGVIQIDNPLEAESIEEVIKAITGLLRTIAIPLGVAMIIWGGIQIMTGYSTGEKEQKVTQGKKTIMWAVIGVAIVVGMDLIVGLIKEFLK